MGIPHAVKLEPPPASPTLSCLTQRGWLLLLLWVAAPSSTGPHRQQLSGVGCPPFLLLAWEPWKTARGLRQPGGNGDRWGWRSGQSKSRDRQLNGGQPPNHGPRVPLGLRAGRRAALGKGTWLAAGGCSPKGGLATSPQC